MACLVKVRLWHELANSINIDRSFATCTESSIHGTGCKCMSGFLLKMVPQGMACLVKVRLCHELADCITIDGSYECVCKDGTTGDGLSCEGKVMARVS